MTKSVVRQSARARQLVPVDWLDFGVVVRDVGIFQASARPLGQAASAFLDVAEGPRIG